MHEWNPIHVAEREDQQARDIAIATLCRWQRLVASSRSARIRGVSLIASWVQKVEAKERGTDTRSSEHFLASSPLWKPHPVTLLFTRTAYQVMRNRLNRQTTRTFL